jgi:hypothetical protein
VLSGVLGLTPAQIDELAEAKVIGDWPAWIERT